MMAAASLAAVDNRPGHAETTGQLACHAQKLLVRPQAHVLPLDVLESREESLLIVVGQGLVGHRKQAVVLLLDMFPREADVAVGMRDEFTANGSARLEETVLW
jgi:hypothetical protein